MRNRTRLRRTLPALLLSLSLYACGGGGDGAGGDSVKPSVPTPATPGTLVAIAAGGWHSLALDNNGVLWTWGRHIDNVWGAYAPGGGNSRLPVHVDALSHAAAASGGDTFTVVLKTDGTVWAWGLNDVHGQLGDNTTINRRDPVRVLGLSNMVAVSSGDTHTIALRADGTVWAWGSNHNGQLGDDSTTDRHVPVQVHGLSGVAAITATAYRQSFAIREDGTVWAWGLNDHGQLGDNTAVDRHVPVRSAIGLSGITSIAFGEAHALALRNDGTVWAWGWNNVGQLGDGTTLESHVPVRVANLSDVRAIQARSFQSFAIRNDNTVWAWGSNRYGQLGDGTTTDRHVPVRVTGLADVRAVASGYSHALALRNDNTVWAWGANDNGQLGDGTTTDRHLPVRVRGL